MEIRNYLELKIPVRRDARWLTKLRHAMSDEKINVKWQDGGYHITVVFVNDNQHVKQLRSAFIKILNGIQAPSITLDKVGVFTKRDGSQHIVYLTSTKPSEGFVSLIDELRGEAKRIGANYDSDFRLHITLGRIEAGAVSLEHVQNLIAKIEIPAFSITIKEAEYKYFRADTIKEWRLG